VDFIQHIGCLIITAHKRAHPLSVRRISLLGFPTMTTASRKKRNVSDTDSESFDFHQVAIEFVPDTDGGEYAGRFHPRSRSVLTFRLANSGVQNVVPSAYHEVPFSSLVSIHFASSFNLSRCATAVGKKKSRYFIEGRMSDTMAQTARKRKTVLLLVQQTFASLNRMFRSVHIAIVIKKYKRRRKRIQYNKT